MKNQPLVSVCCITYNHVKYIRDAIEGFIMQETDFTIEIITHDDASTDGTQEITRKYAGKDERIIQIQSLILKYYRRKIIYEKSK